MLFTSLASPTSGVKNLAPALPNWAMTDLGTEASRSSSLWCRFCHLPATVDFRELWSPGLLAQPSSPPTLLAVFLFLKNGGFYSDNKFVKLVGPTLSCVCVLVGTDI